LTDAFASLNPAQLEAVHHLGGPCLVLAGAGSGKTRVIAHKIVRLLQAGYEPGQIAAITFTNKAAQEMRERAKSLIGPRAAKPLVVSTFHSLGVRILRSDGEALGLKPQFSISTATTCWAFSKTPVPVPTTHWRVAGSGPSARGRTRA
jgi:ATP-dependent DNA helicase Rep